MEEKDNKESKIKSFAKNNNVEEYVIASTIVGNIFEKNFPNGVEMTFEKLAKILAIVKSIEVFLIELPRGIPDIKSLEKDVVEIFNEDIFNDETTIKA